MDEQYRGMTVNERLYVSGLMKEFDRVVRSKDVNGLKRVLARVEITDESAVMSIIETALKNEDQ